MHSTTQAQPLAGSGGDREVAGDNVPGATPEICRRQCLDIGCEDPRIGRPGLPLNVSGDALDQVGHSRLSDDDAAMSDGESCNESHCGSLHTDRGGSADSVPGNTISCKDLADNNGDTEFPGWKLEILKG